MRTRQILAAGLVTLGTAPYLSLAINSSMDPCEIIAQSQAEEYVRLNSSEKGPLTMFDIGDLALDPEMTYNCSRSIPFFADDALETMKAIRATLERHSTLAFLKDPPPSYQQPGIDVIARFDQVMENIKSNKYTNQYDFEVDTMAIARETHDYHFGIGFPLLGFFSYRLDDTIITLSKDGKELPQVYAFSDILQEMRDPSPIIEIEGKSVFEYLRNFVGRTDNLGSMEPHGDWNLMMMNPARDFSSFGSTNTSDRAYQSFQQTPIYNGKSVQGRFANGTDFEWKYRGSCNLALDKGLGSSKDIYQNIVQRPKSPVSSQSNDLSENEDPIEVNSGLSARQNSNEDKLEPLKAFPAWNYPQNPDVLEANFGLGGTVSGYILKEDSVAVLTLPSFDDGSENGIASAANFSNAVSDFISEAKKASVKKVVIDLSGNGGGQYLLGYSIFRQFFPTIQPTVLSRMRAFRELNTFGSVFTGILESPQDVDPETASGIGAWYDDLVILCSHGALDSENKAFRSWKDYYGPTKSHDDAFTNGARFNLSSTGVTESLGFPIPGYAGDESSPPWNSEDIILLHDGRCGSTCSLFSEMMKRDAGVKSVVVGGIPQYGPMQGVSSTRGSRVDLSSFYDEAFKKFNQIREAIGSNVTALYEKWGITIEDVNALPTPLEQTPMKVATRTNSFDMIRPDHLENPLQFTYQASDCRLFYTMESARDIRALWRTVAKFASGDESACVPGSTNAPGADKDDMRMDDVGISHNSTWSNANSTEVPKFKKSGDGGDDNKNKENKDDKDSGARSMTSFAFGGLVAMGLAYMLAF